MESNLILKPNLINALLPKFLKHFFYNLVFFIILYMIYFLIESFMKINYNLEFIFYGLFITIILSFFKISNDLIKNFNTYFIFYSTYLEIKYKFLIINTHSINYSQITNIQITKTIWDRICGVGNIIIHTANDSKISDKFDDFIILTDIKNPDLIKKEIIKKIDYIKNLKR